jgi:hypothetical protein
LERLLVAADDILPDGSDKSIVQACVESAPRQKLGQEGAELGSLGPQFDLVEPDAYLLFFAREGYLTVFT